MRELLTPHQGWWFGGAGMIAGWIMERVDAPMVLAVSTFCVFLALGALWPHIGKTRGRRYAALIIVVVYLGVCVVGAMVMTTAEQSRIVQGISLFERDPESWMGHAYADGPFDLNQEIQPPLETVVGKRQRFNPQMGVALNSASVFDATIFIHFQADGFSDASLEVPRPWQPTEDRTGKTLTFFDFVGDYTKGQRGLPDIDDGWYFTPKKAGQFTVSYTIIGRADTKHDVFPIRRSFPVTVKSATP